MTFDHPIWLILILPLAAAMWFWPMPTRLLGVMRATLLVVMVIAMAGPRVRVGSSPGTLVVLADRSLSMPLGSEQAMKEAIGILQAKQPPDARLAVVSVGRTAQVEQPPSQNKFDTFHVEIDPDGSNLSEGIEAALSLIGSQAPGRILVMSDGRWTGGDPALPAAKAVARRIGIDYRVIARSSLGDPAIDRIEAPGQVNPGEAFMIHAWLYSPSAQDIEFSLKRGQTIISSGSRTLVPGLNRMTFRDRADRPGVLPYTMDIRPSATDAVPENNSARVLVGVTGKKPVLHICQADASGLADILQRGGLDVVRARPEQVDWSLTALADYSAVIIEDTSAQMLGQDGLRNLASWVRSAGGGLMMTGGRNSYGTGGYFHSELDSLLPVSMELRQEHRKFSVAMVVTMDRSGSMSVPAGGGKTKMDLANLAAAQVLDLLTPMDELGVVAVDSSPHVVVPLASIGEKGATRSRILSIQSEGGGIFIYEALANAAAMLAKAKAGTRHILLFADAADSEEPGEYERLLEDCTKAGVTVSVVGLGTKSDCDAALLEDIARRGRGACYFTDDATRLPQIFAQDTFLVSRSTFIEETTGLRFTPVMTALSGLQFANPPALGGYNLCYLRPQANMAAVSQDEYKAPIVAHWQGGLGRVACFTGQADGKFSGAFAAYEQVGEFYSSLARWVSGRMNQPDQDIVLTHRVADGALSIRLDLGKDAQTRIAGARPAVTLLCASQRRGPRTTQARMDYLSAETLGLELPLGADETAVATVEIPGCEPVTLAPVCLPYSSEFAPQQDRSDSQMLGRLARATGGVQRADISQAWQEVPSEDRMTDLAPGLYLATAVLLLLEVFQRRTGLLSQLAGMGTLLSAGLLRLGAIPRRLGLIRILPRLRRPAGRKVASVKTPASHLPTESLATQAEDRTASPTTQSPSSISDAMAQASRRARQRTRDE